MTETPARRIEVRSRMDVPFVVWGSKSTAEPSSVATGLSRSPARGSSPNGGLAQEDTSARGSSKENADPAPGSDATQMRPFMRRTSSEQM